ncbi:lycopene cyclase [Mycobacterium sp. MS1601]|uniref:lycopene cyclase domain-containing protein n=1 Tax=Mycobacterium sp. MS1601 TaxID=1936029 RepID=UPI00097951AD|nr:lycopene cyclase domain-containing protein [Mycobacterium sp. MS1601]AQA01230.1 lycopene cyclase [Mycobacterium sp. MS1601]
MDRWQYLLVLAACLAITAPLEFLGTGVYRQIGRAARAILPVAAVFIAWDLVAILADIWSYNPQYITGVHIGPVPLEELLFFLVIPMCGLLTYSAVEGIVARLRKRSRVRRT